MTSSPFLSVRETAARLGIHHTTLYRSVKDGEFPLTPLRLGKSLRFRAADVERLVGGESIPA